MMKKRKSAKTPVKEKKSLHIAKFILYHRETISLPGQENNSLAKHFRTINPFLPDCKTTFSQIFYIFLCYF